jgi:hypothetical protein
MSDQIRHPSSAIRHPRPSVVELHIGELVLDGFPLTNQAQLEAVVQQELARLFAERGMPAGLASSGDVASLEGGEFHVVPESGAQAIGAQIAQAVYGGLSR